MPRRTCKKYCSGDLIYEIDIIQRTIEPANISYDLDLEAEFEGVPAFIKTLGQKSKFDGSNTEITASHLFVIRFIDEIEEDNSIFYNDKIFKILGTINLNEENRWLEIFTVERGVATAVDGKIKKINWA